MPLLAAIVAAAPLGAQQVAEAERYRIGPGDVLEVRIVELPEIGSGSAKVEEGGALRLPSPVGAVQAAGLTERELELRIAKRLEQYLRKATVSVRVAEYRSRPVWVFGAVQTPGQISIPAGHASLLEVLMQADGLAGDHGERIFIRREADNGLSDQVTVGIEELMERGDPRVNIPILAGDFINVPPAEEITIHFFGAVEEAGAVTVRSSEEVTFLQALSRIGGLPETAASKVRIMRQTEDGRRREIVVDYRKILNGKAEDVPLQDGDLIVVKESFF